MALDLVERERAMDVVKKTSKHLGAIKVNYPLVLSQGMGIVEELSEHVPVICDFKVADIPNTNRLIVEQAVEHGASGIIVHGFVGRDSVAQCVESAGEADVFVVSEMSHPGGLEFTAKVWKELLEVAKDTNARGVIAPATRPEKVREVRKILGNERLILSPGVGTQGGGAKSVLAAGADFFIVGRSIYNADDPAGQAEEFSKVRP